MKIAAWLALPVFILACGITASVNGLFDDGWMFFAFIVVAIPSLFYWRRATYTLPGSLTNMDQENLDAIRKRRFYVIFIAIFGMSFLLMIGITIAMFTIPQLRNLHLVTAGLILLFWLSIVKFGFMNVATHYCIPNLPPDRQTTTETCRITNERCAP